MPVVDLMHPDMEKNPTRFEKRFFAGLLLAAGVFFCWTVAPLFVPLFLGVIIGVVATPLQRRLQQRFGGHSKILAATISFVTVAVSVGLVLSVCYFMVRELMHYLTDTFPQHQQLFERWLRSPRVARMLGHLGQTPAGVMKQAEGYSHTAVEHLTDIVGGVLSATSHAMAIIIFTTITSYYLLVQGRELGNFLVRLVPLPHDETRALMREFHDVAVGTLLGIGVLAVVQGALSALGFWIFGVGKPLVWGALAAFASLLPAVGTGLVCAPVSLVLMLTGHLPAGLALFFYWGLVVVTIPDYWLRPSLMKNHMRLHELLVLVAVFGGIEAFGAIGLLVGPMVVAMFVALLRIYDRDYRPASHEPQIELPQPVDSDSELAGDPTRH